MVWQTCDAFAQRLAGEPNIGKAINGGSTFWSRRPSRVFHRLYHGRDPA
jgi:hypothetical protein